MRKLLIVIALAVLAGCSGNRQAAQEQFVAGQAFEQAGQVDSARVCYQEAIAMDRKCVEAHLAYQDLMLKDLRNEDALWDEYEVWAGEALRDYRAQLLFARLWPDSDKRLEKTAKWAEWQGDEYWVQRLLGEAYQKHNTLNYRSEAIAAYEKAYAIDSNRVDLLKTLTQLCTWDERPAEALRYARRAVELAPERPELLPPLWQARYQASAQADSLLPVLLAEIETVKAVHGENTAFLDALISILYRLDADQAKALQQRVAKLDPQGEWAARQALVSIWAIRQPEKHLADYRDFVTRFPRHMYVPFMMQNYFDGARKTSDFNVTEAEEFATDLVKNEGAEPRIFNRLLSYVEETAAEDWARQEAIAQKWISLSGRRHKGLACGSLGEIYLKQSRWDDAVTVLSTADSLNRHYGSASSSVCANLGRAYVGLEAEEKALACFAQSLGLRQNDEILAEFHRLYEKQHGSLEGAAKYLNQNVLALSALKKPYAAPDLELTMLDGRTVATRDFKGKVVMYALWNPG